MKVSLILISVLLCTQLKAQPNLVPNPGFEDYHSCIDSCLPCYDTTNLCYTWQSTLDCPIRTCNIWYDPTCATSDYFNSVFNNLIGFGNWGVPSNQKGNQMAHTGNAYVGLGVELTGSIYYPYYEYVSAKLSEPLKPNQKYCVTYYVSPGDHFSQILQNIDIAFHPDSVIPHIPDTNISTPLLPFNAQIRNLGTNIIDKTVWTELRGILLASGIENYLTIGCFVDSTQFNIYNSGSGNPAPVSYIYIDDVSVIELKALHSRDTAICANTQFPVTLKAYPNFDHYTWNTGDTTRLISINQAGDYIVTASSWCGTTTDTITVSYFDTTVFSQYLGNDLNLCPSQFPYLFHSNPLGLQQYQWSTGDTAQNIYLNQPGQYVLTAQSVCHTVQDTIVVNMLPAPEVNLGNDTILCNNQSITLQATAAQSYLWNTLDTTQQISVSQSGTYTVIVNYANGCQAQDAINITSFNPINYQLNIGNDTGYCANDFPIILQTNNVLFDAYLWSTGSINTAINIQNSGLYTLYASYACGTVTDSITITLNPTPQFTLGLDTTLCIGQQITLSGPPDMQYQWSTGESVQSITVNQSGNYMLIVTNAYDCSSSDEIQISFEQATALLLPDDASYYADEIPVKITVLNGFSQLLWSDGSTSNSIEVNEAGLYWVQGKDALGCLVNDSINIRIKERQIQIPGIVYNGQALFIKDLPDGSSIKVFDTLGNLVYTQDNYANNWTPVLSKAIYMVLIITPDHKTINGKTLVTK